MDTQTRRLIEEYLDCLSYQEVARRTGLNKMTVHNRINRAVERAEGVNWRKRMHREFFEKMFTRLDYGTSSDGKPMVTMWMHESRHCSVCSHTVSTDGAWVYCTSLACGHKERI